MNVVLPAPIGPWKANTFFRKRLSRTHLQRRWYYPVKTPFHSSKIKAATAENIKQAENWNYVVKQIPIIASSTYITGITLQYGKSTVESRRDGLQHLRHQYPQIPRKARTQKYPCKLCHRRCNIWHWYCCFRRKLTKGITDLGYKVKDSHAANHAHDHDHEEKGGIKFWTPPAAFLVLFSFYCHTDAALWYPVCAYSLADEPLGTTCIDHTCLPGWYELLWQECLEKYP